MKILIVLTSLVFPFLVHSQQATTWMPLYFVDNVKMDTKAFANTYYNPDKLASINVDGNYWDSANHVHGKIFLAFKPGKITFLSASDIINKYAKSSGRPVLFIINNDFLKDTSGLRIDTSYILKVEFTSSSEIDYLKGSVADLSILKIFTKTKENLDKQKEVHIRGNNAVALTNLLSPVQRITGTAEPAKIPQSQAGL